VRKFIISSSSRDRGNIAFNLIFNKNKTTTTTFYDEYINEIKDIIKDDVGCMLVSSMNSILQENYIEYNDLGKLQIEDIQISQDQEMLDKPNAKRGPAAAPRDSESQQENKGHNPPIEEPKTPSGSRYLQPRYALQDQAYSTYSNVSNMPVDHNMINGSIITRKRGREKGGKKTKKYIKNKKHTKRIKPKKPTHKKKKKQNKTRKL